MRIAGIWTYLVSLAIAALLTVICASALGGGIVGWLLGIPAMFLLLHLIGIPVVVVCEFAEKIGCLPRRWRPVADEVLLVGVFLAAGSQALPGSACLVVSGFFGLMYLLRIVLHRCWIPGEPEEVGP